MQERKVRPSAKATKLPDNDVVESDLVFTGERIVPEADNCEPNFASRMYQEHIARYLFASQIVANKLVIDIGCGVGYGSQRIAQLGASSVYAFDLSDDAIRHARTHYAHPNLEFTVANAEQFKTDKLFDVAICFELIEHVPHPRRVLENIRTSLKGDGILIMSTPRALEQKRTHFHEHEFDLEEYIAMIEEHFPNVEMYVENNHFSSLVTKGPPSDVRNIFCLKDQFEPKVADVFIAVASPSRVSLPHMEPALSLDSDAYVTMLERDVAILHKAEDDLRERVEATERENLERVAFKDAEIERLTGEYKALFARSETLSTQLWEAEQKNAQIERLTSESSALRDRAEDLLTRLQDLEMKHAELEQEHTKLREQLQREEVRAADADERRSKAYEFARTSSEQAHGLRRELETLKRDIDNALERPGDLQSEPVDHRHKAIVESMERLFLGTEATHFLVRDPLVDRVNELALRSNQLMNEIHALQEFQRHAEDWHAQLLRMRRSFSWRLTAPFRGLARPFRKRR